MKMTEQEAWELDDLLTRTDPELGPNGTGFLSRKEARLGHGHPLNKLSDDQSRSRPQNARPDNRRAG